MGVTPSIHLYGRAFYLVQSRSRPNLEHLVDMEANEYGKDPACSCEANRLRMEECPHIKAVKQAIAAPGCKPVR